MIQRVLSQVETHYQEINLQIALLIHLLGLEIQQI